jgi:hypothetical protein
MMGNVQRFRSTMDGFVRGITLGYFVLIVAIAAGTHNPWITIFLVVVAVTSFALNPTSYAVSEDDLGIELRVGARVIPLRSIVRAERLARLPYIRVFGIGGLFGYYGLYWSKATGTVRMYGRNRHNPILLVLHGGTKIVIMPDDISILDRLVKV